MNWKRKMRKKILTNEKKGDIMLIVKSCDEESTAESLLKESRCR